MSAERIQEWVKELRSGEYTQAKGGLRTTDDHFCCLGVACDLADSKRWDGDDSLFKFYLDEAGRHIGGVWPVDIQERYGLTSGESVHLWNMNDAGNSFSEIADYIERKILPRVAASVLTPTASSTVGTTEGMR